MGLRWKWDDKHGTAQYGGMGDCAQVVWSSRSKRYPFVWHVRVNHYLVQSGESTSKENAQLAAEAWEAENGDRLRKEYGGYGTREEADKAKRNALVGTINEARNRIRRAQEDLVAAEESLCEFDEHLLKQGK